MKVKDGSIQESGQKDILGMTLGNPEYSGRVRGVKWRHGYAYNLFQSSEKNKNK